jgi:hypothetical protein
MAAISTAEGGTQIDDLAGKLLDPTFITAPPATSPHSSWVSAG